MAFRSRRKRSGFRLLDDLFELGFMLGGAAGARDGVDYPRGFWLAHALPSVGFDRLGGGKFPWLAFRHGKYEYEGSPTGVEGPPGFQVLVAGAEESRGSWPQVLPPGWRAGKPWKSVIFSTKQPNSAPTR